MEPGRDSLLAGGRAWTFCSIGYGHDAKSFQDLISTLRMVGYDYVISIEHEDAMMSIDNV